jgi:hypothetical protein
MCRVATHARYGVVEDDRDCLDGTRIGNVIEDLDTPPTDPGILVGQSFYDGAEDGRRKLDAFEVRGRNSTSEPAKGLDLKTPLPELLNQELFWCHRGKRIIGALP